MANRHIAKVLLLVCVIAGFTLIKYIWLRPDPVLHDIIIAVPVQPLSAQMYIAEEKGFFREQGLKVTLQPYQAGKDALEAVIQGEAHFCTVADTPVMFAWLKGEKIYVIATIADSTSYVKIVARKDRGITGPRSLKGKTVGVRMGTSSEYFLYAYLTFNQLKLDDIRMVDVQLGEMADALDRGEIDAAASWDPYLDELRTRLGNNGITLRNDYIYNLDWNMVSGQEFTKKYPDTAVKLLKSLIRATDYIAENHSEAQMIVERYIGRKTAEFTRHTFDVHLDQSLLVNLDNQTRWAIQSRLVDAEEVPDFLPLIYTEGLQRIKPEAVTVIHK